MTARLRLATFPLSVLQLQSLWRHTPGFKTEAVSPSAYTHIAQVAERGGIDYLFVPDKNTANAPLGDGDYTIGGNSWPEPVTMMSYLAAVTDHIGLVATASTAWNEPYIVARMFQSLDHFSRGRAGWNAVGSHMGLEDHNFAHRPSIDADERKLQHAEFVDVVHRLWDSWDDDAVVADVEHGRWSKPGSVRSIDAHGRFFSVNGPLNIHRSPQGRPIVIQAGASERFRAEAARSSDVVFTKFDTEADAIEFTADLRQKVIEAGRPEGSVLVMPSATYSPGGEGAPMEGHLHFEGSPAAIAERMIALVDAGACDGFTLLPTLLPTDLEWFVGEVIPELCDRGVFSVQTSSTTLRERLGLPDVRRA